jgi:hypothetical protein
MHQTCKVEREIDKKFLGSKMEIPENLIERFHAAVRTFYEHNERRLNAKQNISEELKTKYLENIRAVCSNVERIGKNVKEMIEHCADLQMLCSLAEAVQHPRTADLLQRYDRARESTNKQAADLIAMMLQMEEGKFPSGIKEE